MFKTMYADGIDPKQLVRDKPLLQWAPHKTNFTTARGFEVPAPYVNPQGIGPTNATAAANEVSTKGVAFLVPQRHHYAFGAIDGEVVRNAESGDNESQYVDAMEREIDGATEALGVEIHQRMYGDKSGVRSYLSATTTINSTTWTLANEEDAQYYEVGMKIVPVNPATGLPRVGTAVSVSSVNGVTLICSGNINSFTSAAAGDGIARDGFATAGGGLDLDGLNGWCPITVASSGDSFNGVDRYVYRNRLAGVYVDISNDPIRSGFIKAKAKAKAQVGTMFEASAPFFINPKNLAQIMQSVEQAKITDLELADTYEIGLEAVKIMGHTFVSDSLCPVNTAYLVGTGAFARATCGDQPKLDNIDGNEFFFNRRTGVLEFVMVHDGNTVALKPYNIMRVSLPTAAL
jgi:hypothetical protein